MFKWITLCHLMLQWITLCHLMLKWITVCHLLFSEKRVLLACLCYVSYANDARVPGLSILYFSVSLFKMVPYTSGKIWSAPLIFFLAVCLHISTVINIKILTNSKKQTQSYEFISHIAAFLAVVLITEMLDICIQTSYDQNVQLILKSYLPVLYGTSLSLCFTSFEY